jgi:dTMP kinase
MSDGRGRLIALEGGEGSGKSTQARLLAERLGAVLTREPGGTALGAEIRRLLLDPASVVDPRAEALLMAADRAQHVAEVIAPALAAGRDVVTDRFVGSSLAYQAYGRGLPLDEVRGLSVVATGGLEPDLVVLISVPAAVAAARVGPEPDRLEAEGGGFHERVAEGYEALAVSAPDRWEVVDGEGSVDEVAERIAAAVEARLGRP